jgi:D-threo-aldose 1-dehydrogenase
MSWTNPEICLRSRSMSSLAPHTLRANVGNRNNGVSPTPVTPAHGDRVGDLVTVGGVTTSRLGFGCASLMRKSKRERMALLDTAFDSGIRHFDVAAMYGLGQTEYEIGKFAFGRRDQITIATKFGLGVPRWLAPLAPYQDPVRAALEHLPKARHAAKERSDRPAPPRTYSAADAERSLELSLRKLGTDYVDIFFVHDPSPNDDVRADELVDFFTRAKAAGKIRAWGVSQDAHPELAVQRQLGPSAVLQVRADIFSEDRPHEPCITFGVIGRAYSRVLDALRTDFTARARWSRELELDLTQPEVIARLLLNDALASNNLGVVLYSTLNTDRLRRTAVQSSVHPDLAQVTRMRELIRSELS